ncbi:AAA family ATPase [Erwiniaceae bacterium BAC15a-03b]|uniref:AAA family ATPase n=1 Tax=Winslowiella arboricola TaxID=2978220 RepID=A0A9J6PHI6_9GAMM|nr:AAA family ATPase [Winslowiella arboricola]MCU5773875.1 AAA family ATPase [Winslowiella arboricola]MCU5777785.1 AAA family ATPase [Winslowiella arboricola]
MRLESIILKNIGVFAHTRFDFPAAESVHQQAEIYILTGPNGCGKSTLLHALAAIFTPEPQHHPRLTPRYGEHARVDYQFAGKKGYYTAVKSEPVACIAAQKQPFTWCLTFADTCGDNDFMAWIIKNRTRSALMQVAGETRQQQQQDEIFQRIIGFISDISGLKLVFSLDSALHLNLNINGKPTSLTLLPEGLKSVLSWITHLTASLEGFYRSGIFSQPLLLFLDEIDIHLHPTWQRRLLPALQKLLTGAQIFISTHSPFVVGSVEDAWIYCLPDPQCAVPGVTPAAAEIVPLEAAAGKSYQLILEEVFKVEEQFDIETEALLQAFYQQRNRCLKSRTSNDSELTALANKIRERGEELETIVEMELRQLNRRIKG